MRAVRFQTFGELPRVEEVPDPVCPPRGAVVRVGATGVCRSDWHAWRGHDDSVSLPHVPGHEFAGTVEEVGAGVEDFAPGDRVTAPFVFACGRCEQCLEGHGQVCASQRQPGFDLPGSYAEKVVVLEADANLVRLPESIGFAEAAGLGCRFGTAYHALHVQGRVRAGEKVAVFGCGGVGLSAVMIAAAAGADVYAVDPYEGALARAQELGAVPVRGGESAVEELRAATGGGVHLALDAFGSRQTCRDAVLALRPRGRQVQVGLLLGEEAQPDVPMGRVVAQELEIRGSHGLAQREYARLLEDVVAGRLGLDRTVGRRIGLEDLPEALAAMGGTPTTSGMTVAVLGA